MWTVAGGGAAGETAGGGLNKEVELSPDSNGGVVIAEERDVSTLTARRSWGGFVNLQRVVSEQEK